MRWRSLKLQLAAKLRSEVPSFSDPVDSQNRAVQRPLLSHAHTGNRETVMTSFNATLQDYDRSLRDEKKNGRIPLLNDNLDTGTATGPGEYPLTDKTYATLLDRLAGQHFEHVSVELGRAILDYYNNSNEPFGTEKTKKEWAKVRRELDGLRTFTPSNNDP